MLRQYLVIFLFLSFVIAVVWNITGVSSLYRFLAVLNAGIATFFLFTYQYRPYSLHKVVNLFVLFFFVIANAVQYSTRTNTTTFPLTTLADDAGAYERFQFLVLCILVCYNFLYPLFKKASPVTDTRNMILSSKRLLLLAFFSLACTIFYYRNAIPLMFVRGLSDTGEIEMQNLGGGNVGLLLFDKVIRALSFACLIWAVHLKHSKTIRVVLFLTMLITLFPTALARNATAMYWMPVLFLLFRFMERKNVFVLTMLLGLLVIFPFLENFRHWKGDFSSVGLSFDFMNEMHFDASQNFMILLKLDVVTWGRQLLGVFLFWLPRSLWESKPIGSGHFVAEQYSDFTNISMPFFAEGYINFGYIGILAFVFFLAWFCAYFDSMYWESRHRSSRITPYYLLLISSLLFVLRGDLMSSTAYTFATLFDIYVVSKISAMNQTCSERG